MTGVVHAPCPAFERTLTLAASVAAGMVAWDLWRDRERTTPLLALQRFGDLDARVRFDDEAVRVRLPLGRRHQELSRGGLLAPVRDLPWLEGRRVEFSGG